MPDMSDPVFCDLCGAAVPPNAHYIVRIDVFADPSTPEMTMEELDEIASENQLAILMQELELMTEDEAQDQVHRSFEYTLCSPCQRKFLANPLGRPRTNPISQQGHN
jgi:hypothetical protein